MIQEHAEALHPAYNDRLWQHRAEWWERAPEYEDDSAGEAELAQAFLDLRA